MLSASALSYFLHGNTIAGVRALGFPDFFRYQLGVLKLIAVVVLLAPGLPVYVRDWAYAGAGLFFLTAIVAHAAHRDPWFINLINVVFLALLIVSNLYMRKLNQF